MGHLVDAMTWNFLELFVSAPKLGVSAQVKMRSTQDSRAAELPMVAIVNVELPLLQLDSRCYLWYVVVDVFKRVTPAPELVKRFYREPGPSFPKSCCRRRCVVGFENSPISISCSGLHHAPCACT